MRVPYGKRGGNRVDIKHGRSQAAVTPGAPTSSASVWVGVAIVLALFAVILLSTAHADIIKSALLPNVKAPGRPTDGSQSLVAGAKTLANDATAILIPAVSLASAGGGIAWALGSQRGQGVVIGALIAGVAVVAVNTIVA